MVKARSDPARLVPPHDAARREMAEAHSGRDLL
jgi:hypothetical protein